MDTETQAIESTGNEGDAPADTTPQAGGQETKWTQEQQAEFDKRAASLRKAAEAEGRKRAQAEFEAKQQADKDAAEQARLLEEGKYKEISANSEKAKAEAEKRAADAEAKSKNLELKISFAETAQNLKIEFANAQAKKDAFEHLDRELIGEDIDEGMRKAFEKLQKEHPHYFGVIEQPNTDARQNGKRQTNQQSEKDKQEALKTRFTALNRRPG